MTSRRILLVLSLTVLAGALLPGCARQQTSQVSNPPSMPQMHNMAPPGGGDAGNAEAKPPADGKKLEIAISSKPGQWNLDERERGYRETIKNEFPQLEVVQTIDDETKYSVGEQRASAVLSAHPDVAGFAGCNAASGPGIAAAVQGASKAGQVVIVAMDGNSAILDKIESGVITASVAQRQYYMTYIGVKYLYGLAHGYFRSAGFATKAPNSAPEVPGNIDTGTVEINKDNVNVFRTPSQGAKEELDAKHPEWKALLADRKQGEAKASEEYVCIGISTGVEYWNASRQGLKDVCAELGVKGTLDGPPDQNPEQQANIMDRVIARKPAGIIIAPGHPETLKPYINKAIEAGIPVICIDTDAPDSKRIAYFGTSNFEAGVTGAKILAKAVLEKQGG